MEWLPDSEACSATEHVNTEISISDDWKPHGVSVGLDASLSRGRKGRKAFLRTSALRFI